MKREHFGKRTNSYGRRREAERSGYMRRSETKTISEFIIDALREGSFLRTPDITDRVVQASGREIRLQDISSVLTKITSYKMSDLGCLIEKKKTHRG